MPHGDYYPAPKGNFRVRAKLFARTHVVWGCTILLFESFLIPYPFNVLTGIIAAGISVDIWTHQFFH